MKRTIYLSVASIILLLASGCSEEKFGVNPDTYDDSGAIVFSNSSISRAEDPARTPADIPYVIVKADLDTGDGNSTYFNNYQFDRTGSQGSYLYKSSRNPVWPPEGTLTFKAYYPSLQEMYEANYTWEGGVPSPTIDDNLVIHNFALAKNNSYPLDLMTATPKVNVETFDTKKSVDLNLKHQLTGIDIRVFNESKTDSTENEGVKIYDWGHVIEIAGIRIKNVPVAGDFDINEGKWLPENTKTTTFEYIFQPNDKILKLGRLGEHHNLCALSGGAFTFYYNQYDSKEKAADLLKYCGMESITMLPTEALTADKEDGEVKKIELQLLIRIIQDFNAFDSARVRRFVAIYPNDVGYRYNDAKGGYYQVDGTRYIQSDRDDCSADNGWHNQAGAKTVPILLRDDKIENIMEYFVEERDECPGDVGTTFTLVDDNNIAKEMEGEPYSRIMKDFRIIESAQYYGNGDNYFDQDEISALRNTVPYNYGDPGVIPKGCIRRFAWIDIPLTVKDKDGKEVGIACEAGKKYTWNIDFTNSLKNVTQQIIPPSLQDNPDEVNSKELGKFAIELKVTVDEWKDEDPEETLPAIGAYTPSSRANF